MRAAALQQQRMIKNAETNAARLKAADQARSEGNIALACRVYLRVGADRSEDSSVMDARKRLAELKIEATEKHTDLMGRLDSLLVAPDAPPLEGSEARGLEECMAQFQELADTYGKVPGIGRTIRLGLSTHLKKPAVRSVLYEPQAKELWRTGQHLESGGHICCAMLVYQEAQQAVPAPSADKAQQRLKELSTDPANVRAAEACRQLRWCHERFRTAERLVKGNPDRARELLREIAERSPEDSEVHREATRLLAELQ